MNHSGIHYFAIRHDFTGLWFMKVCDNFDIHAWTSDLYMADVWQPADMHDADLQVLPPNTHWQAFTWDEYCHGMRDCPVAKDWVAMLDARA